MLLTDPVNAGAYANGALPLSALSLIAVQLSIRLLKKAITVATEPSVERRDGAYRNARVHGVHLVPARR
jgi:hypothetical protein